ncbi:hypothetical protein Dsin_031035 [Dipteronia sinensis]|uniref:Uncharacterized protein n=1 Tax=Dipteronia sinensis TaxID=43782 RepID=A0AAD9ZM57_9ROSI|nr:hypothetical protein Dsin_031035 [Dipteronia sinensis]
MGDYVGTSIEFHLKDRWGRPLEDIQVKHCGIHPMFTLQRAFGIYLQHLSVNVVEACPAFTRASLSFQLLYADRLRQC